MNKVYLIGRTTKEIELRYTASGTANAKFTLAVDRRKREDGTRETDFISCVAWARLAETVSKYVPKGTKIAVNGRLQTGSYEKDGRKVYTTDVIVEDIEFVERRQDGGAANAPQAPQTAPQQVEFDNDLPF